METEGADVVGRWVREHLQDLVQPALLEAFDIVLDDGLQWQLILVEVDFVPRCQDNQPVIMKELRLSDLIRELRIEVLFTTYESLLIATNCR
jgi:hypothetical protein